MGYYDGVEDDDEGIVDQDTMEHEQPDDNVEGDNEDD
jgi:hypothetical protein